MKKYRRAIALFLAIGLMVLIPSGMGVSASGNTVEAKMSENIAQVLSMTGIEREEYSDQQVIDVDGQIFGCMLLRGRDWMVKSIQHL